MPPATGRAPDPWREAPPRREPGPGESRLRLVAAAGLAFLGLLFLVAAAVSFQGSAGQAYDLAAYLDAARRIAAGASPYQAATLTGPFSPGPGGLYLYAPPLAVLVLPLTGLPSGLTATLWTAAHLLALAASCLLMPVARWIRAATFAIGAVSLPVLLDLNLGNVSLFVLLAGVAIWRWHERPAGPIALGAALLVRPPLVAVALVWLLRGRLPALAWTIGTLAAAVALTLPVVGVGGYIDYLRVVRNVGSFTGVPRNADAASAALALGLPVPAALFLLVAGGVLALLAIVAASRRDGETAVVVALGGALLLSPLLWAHYLVALLIPAAFLAGRGLTWALLLPLLGWLPEPALPLAAAAATVTPLLAPKPAPPPATPPDPPPP
jgi:hypothetical protein